MICENEGIRADGIKLKEYGDKLAVSITELEKKIYEAAGEEFNINSPKQLGVILFEKLGLPNEKKTKTGYSTAADVLIYYFIGFLVTFPAFLGYLLGVFLTFLNTNIL